MFVDARPISWYLQEARSAEAESPARSLWASGRFSDGTPMRPRHRRTMGCARARHFSNLFDCPGGSAAVGGRAPYAARVRTSGAVGCAERDGHTIRDGRKSIALPVKARGAIECPQLRSADLDVLTALDGGSRRALSASPSWR